MSSASSSSNDPLGLVAHLVDQLVRLGEPARDQLGRGATRAVRAASVVTTIRTPSSERWRRSRSATSRDVADAEAVDERHARLDVVDDARHAVASSSTTSPFSAITIALGGHARVAREPRVRGQHPELAVDRHDRLRPQEREQRAQLLGVAVARDVHGRVLLVQHLRPGLREPVDRVVDAQLVPGNGLARR